MGRLFAVVSGKGGVGKSSFSVILARQISLTESVIVLDLDERLGSLDTMFNVADNKVFNINDCINKTKTVNEAALKVNPNLFLLAAPADELNLNGLYEFLLGLSFKYQNIILDLPAGLNVNLLKAIPSFCEFLVVCQQDSISVKDAFLVGEKLRELDFFEPRLIINRYVYKRSFRSKILGVNIDNIIDNSALRLLGIIPENEEMALLFLGKHLKRNNKAKQSVKRITERLYGKNVPLPNIKKI